MKTSGHERRVGRRLFLKRLTAFAGLALTALAGVSPKARAQSNVPHGKLEEAIVAAIGKRAIRESDSIKLEAPQIAENGAIVPITVESTLPDVREMLLFVEKNPTPLAARFRFEKDMDAFASLRIKMNESCEVLAVVRSRDEFYGTRRKVKVMVGGCG
ncbi:MAG: putative secreted protein [Proteobacteria bacterium]|nr:putative secreted protein [Pseudomonadota bacterium]